MFTEDDLLPLSALQHLLFCERQCALIHVEQVWADNRLTVEGTQMHERVHEIENESRGDVRIVRGLRLRSLRLGLSGVADVVEFHRGDGQETAGCQPAPLWQPFPVEYKRGRPNPTDCDRVRLCAQALCLEEMLGVDIPAGAIFYGVPRRRLEVAFDESLRRATEEAAARLHRLFDSRQTPPARYEKKCQACSLLDLCMPKAVAPSRSAAGYLKEALALSTSEGKEGS